MLDENEFLSAYGIRALSKYHLEHPYIFNVEGKEYKVGYLLGESDTGCLEEIPIGVGQSGCPSIY